MKIKNVHCLFEQSGTFKQEFIKLGYTSFDYDIQDNFGQTDFKIDLFDEIYKGWHCQPSIFDIISPDDLIMAFFPCTYFEVINQSYFSFDNRNIKHLDKKKQYDVVMHRITERWYYYLTLYELCGIVETRGLRMILENPATQPSYLLFSQNFIKKPTFIDKNRTLRGDYFVKPTGYWFFNCEPTYGESLNVNKKNSVIYKTNGNLKKESTYSQERSLISLEYAKNFIADFILGKQNENTIKTLFD